MKCAVICAPSTPWPKRTEVLRRNAFPPVTSERALRVDDEVVLVQFKRIRHVYLKVSRSDGGVRVSAPLHTPESHIRRFIRAKRAWIERARMRATHTPVAEIGVPRDGTLRLWGRAVGLQVHTVPGRGRVDWRGEDLCLRVRDAGNASECQRLLEAWLRTQLAGRIDELVAQHQKNMPVQVKQARIRRMRTRWGSCNIRAARIWLNLALIERPPECLEYVVVHEMVHLLEASHNRRFKALMDHYLPDWRRIKARLNAPPEA